jgi:hypothetical protein
MDNAQVRTVPQTNHFLLRSCVRFIATPSLLRFKPKFEVEDSSFQVSIQPLHFFFLVGKWEKPSEFGDPLALPLYQRKMILNVRRDRCARTCHINRPKYIVDRTFPNDSLTGFEQYGD